MREWEELRCDRQSAAGATVRETTLQEATLQEATVQETTWGTVMVHLTEKAHLDKATIDRVESAVILALIGSALAACAFGAIVFDFGRMLSVW